MHASIQKDLWPTVTVQGHSYYLSKCSFVNSKNNTTYRRMVIIVDECGTVGDELCCRRCLQKVISRSFDAQLIVSACKCLQGTASPYHAEELRYSVDSEVWQRLQPTSSQVQPSLAELYRSLDRVCGMFCHRRFTLEPSVPVSAMPWRLISGHFYA